MSPGDSLLLPSLCHPHVHLDKAYLLTCGQFDDLAPQSGTFAEALSNTSAAKQRYTPEDLRLRGSQLIAESVRYGVTSMRAFVEVDHAVELKCLEIGRELKHKFDPVCFVQLCIFAQDPIFSTEHGEANRNLLETALEHFKGVVDVLGSTPYVETSEDASHANIDWAIDTAIKHHLHLDFHLDYNLDSRRRADLWYVLGKLDAKKWNRNNPGKTIALGHCTRLTLFSTRDLTEVKQTTVDDTLPVSFIGLPTSDLYMMARPDEQEAGHADRSRGTLQILSLIKEYELNAAIGINNVGNAFTPWGSADPLRLASMGVGLYHAGTGADAQLLYECVSTRARKAIGLGGAVFPQLRVKQEADAEMAGVTIPARQRRSVRDVVWDPPDAALRELVYVKNSS